MPRTDKLAAILVDGSNIYAAAKALGFSIDYKKLVDTFDGSVLKLYYFTALRAADEESLVRPLADYLVYNGWNVITKPTKEWKDPLTGQIKIKGNMDIEIATVALELAPHITDLVLCSGDGDFAFMLESLQRRYAVNVTVVSTIMTRPAMCADELRRQADTFIDLYSIRDIVRRNGSEKSQ